VLGGTGFVGSRVVEALVARGAEVVSVSKSGKPAAIKGAEKVTWQAADVLTADLSKTFTGADAVISCIGKHSVQLREILLVSISHRGVVSHETWLLVFMQHVSYKEQIQCSVSYTCFTRKRTPPHPPYPA
jgi:putative NADH-flavin reductase